MGVGLGEPFVTGGRKLSVREAAVIEMTRARAPHEPPTPIVRLPPDYTQGDLCRVCWGFVTPIAPLFIQNWFHRRDFGHNIVVTGETKVVNRGER